MLRNHLHSWRDEIVQLFSRSIPPVPETGLKSPSRSCSCEMEPKALTSALCMTQYLSITTTTKSSETKAGGFVMLLKPWRGYARGGEGWVHRGWVGSIYLPWGAILGQNPVLIDPNQPHYQLKMFRWKGQRMRNCAKHFFPSKTQYVTKSAYIHINKERVFIQINEENNALCAIPDFFKI